MKSDTEPFRLVKENMTKKLVSVRHIVDDCRRHAVVTVICHFLFWSGGEHGVPAESPWRAMRRIPVYGGASASI